MNGIPSSTYFTVAPDWGWLIVCYFFFGGLAGGCYFLAVLIDFFGRIEDRPLARFLKSGGWEYSARSANGLRCRGGISRFC